jgi:hypothetical protein
MTDEALKAAQEAEKKKDAALIAKAKEIDALPDKALRASALISYEQQKDRDHVTKAAQDELAAEAAEKDAEDAETARAEAVKIIGESKEALQARLREKYGERFTHTITLDKETGDTILLSLVLLSEGERSRRVSTAKRIVKVDADLMSRDDVAALEVEQLHVLAQRLGV